MDGHAVFVEAVAPHVRGVAGARAPPPTSTLDDIDLFVYHQANARILSSLTERLDLPPERVVSAIARDGQHLRRVDPARARATPATTGSSSRGARVLLAAFGAGLHLGAPPSSPGDRDA